MARWLLAVVAIFACGVVPAYAQNVLDPQNTPPARLIRPRPGKTDARPIERPYARPGPLDERCRPLRDQLEAALLSRPGNGRRAQQARVAHNAGARFCREGNPDRGIAEFQRGLAILQGQSHP